MIQEEEEEGLGEGLRDLLSREEEKLEDRRFEEELEILKMETVFLFRVNMLSILSRAKNYEKG